MQVTAIDRSVNPKPDSTIIPKSENGAKTFGSIFIKESGIYVKKPAMSDLAPLVLSDLRDKTVVDLKAENDKLSEEATKLQAERDEFLRYAIKHGRVEIRRR